MSSSQAIGLALYSVGECDSVAPTGMTIGGIGLDQGLFEFWVSISLHSLSRAAYGMRDGEGGQQK